MSMSEPISQLANGAFSQMFDAMENILQKAEDHARAQDLDEGVMLAWRLTPDMFPMARQIQIACDVPARGLSRLANADLPSFEDTESDFAGLKARVAKARDHINGLDVAAILADPDGTVVVPLRGEDVTMPRQLFLSQFIMPNLYFHVSTAYAILRTMGVQLGKGDFLARSL
ncbi:MAG: DUF1993 domain-containing protein [Pseudomonadota bacterium]